MDWFNEFNRIMQEDERISTISEPEITDMETMMNLINPSRSIIVDNNIGLIGEFQNEVPEITTEPEEILDLRQDNPPEKLIKRGDYYRVIDREGCILVDESIIFTGTLEPSTYIFLLRDYKIEDNISKLLDNPFEEPGYTVPSVNAILVYHLDTNTFETNSTELINNSPQLQYSTTYNKNLTIEYQSIYKIITINGISYYPVAINVTNEIYKLIETPTRKDMP